MQIKKVGKNEKKLQKLTKNIWSVKIMQLYLLVIAKCNFIYLLLSKKSCAPFLQ